MPYNTRRKSLSLPSLGIHIPVTHAARAAAASNKATRRPSSSSSSSSSSTSSSSSSSSSSPSFITTSISSSPSTPAQPSQSPVEAMESHPYKRLKRSHGCTSGPNENEFIVEQTPPPSPTPATSLDMSHAKMIRKTDLEGINDDIVEASILQLQSTANRPHLIKELATVLYQKLSSVQQSANPCAIISSRLTSYMKRSCWNVLAPCPLAKELEPVHPRRTYFFLTTCPRQSLPDSNTTQPIHHSTIVTPSVSLTDDSGSDDVDARRRELSPSPEVDLSSPDLDDVEEAGMPMTPMGSFKCHGTRVKQSRDLRRNSPPLETDEREFTQTADVLQKRKLAHNDDIVTPEMIERNSILEYGYRDDPWFGDRALPCVTLLASPAMRPSTMSGMRKEDEADSWLKLNKLFEWDRTAESIEIDELDCLLDTC